MDPARKKLKEMEMDIPEADPVAVARMQYEKENYIKSGMLKRSTAFLTRGPDMSHAAKSGAPPMTTLKPSIPASVPIPVETIAAPAGVSAGGTTDVTISTGLDKNSSIDTKPDARMSPPPVAGATVAASPAVAAATPAVVGAQDPLPVNHTGTNKSKPGKPGKPKKEKKAKTPAPAAVTPAAAAAQPAKAK